jgi:hypothetical protein
MLSMVSLVNGWQPNKGHAVAASGAGFRPMKVKTA